MIGMFNHLVSILGSVKPFLERWLDPKNSSIYLRNLKALVGQMQIQRKKTLTKQIRSTPFFLKEASPADS